MLRRPLAIHRATQVACFSAAMTAACGNAAVPPAAPANPPATASPVAATAPAAPAPVDKEVYDDPGEANDPATLVPLFASGAPPAFPSPTTGERECWRTVGISGDARVDYAALIARCGTATGAVQYVTPSFGRLHHVHDKRDTYVVHIHKGLCYRFFGVADGTIQNLDILIEHMNGALVGDDKTNGPVAIIESDKAWCFDADGDYQFGVKIDGPGDGHYVFGIWARPKK